MGANNFHYRNASKAYVICRETAESWEFDDETAYISERIQKEKNGRSYYRVTSQFELRSYPTRYLASLITQREFGDVEIEINVHAFARSGYYEAACLDYEVEISVDGYAVEQPEVFERVQNADSRVMNVGMLTIQAANAQKWVDKAVTILENQMEGIFAECSEQYVCTAIFSNGEAIYQKVG